MTRTPVRRTFKRATPAPQKPVIYPAGTQMSDIPPLAKGISPMEFLDLCIARWKQAPIEMPAPPVAAVPTFGRRRA